MNTQNPSYMFPGFPGTNFPGGNNWNPNTCNCREQLNRLDNKIDRLERQVRRLENRISRLEGGFPTPFASSDNFDNNNYNNFNSGMYMI